jgi:hypothetical protein
VGAYCRWAPLPGAETGVKRGRLNAARRGGWGAAARTPDTWVTAGRRSRSQPPPWVTVAGAWLATAGRPLQHLVLCAESAYRPLRHGVRSAEWAHRLPFVEVWRRGFLLRCLRREVALGGCVVPCLTKKMDRYNFFFCSFPLWLEEAG